MHLMKVLPHLFVFLFGLASFLGCSPNTTSSANPCTSSNVNFTDCFQGGDIRFVYCEVTVSPPLPTTTLSPTGEYISFMCGIGIGGPGIQWNSYQQANSLSTLTSDCFGLDSRNQHHIFAGIHYNHPTNYQYPFVPWIGQCHSLDLKVYSIDGTLIDSWFVPSIGTFVNGQNNDWTPTFNYCGLSGLYPNIGTLILPSCP